MTSEWRRGPPPADQLGTVRRRGPGGASLHGHRIKMRCDSIPTSGEALIAGNHPCRKVVAASVVCDR